jgi:hypothetical protein
VAGIADAANAYYQQICTCGPNPLPGTPLEGGRYEFSVAHPQPPCGPAVFGSNAALTDDFWGDFWKQGGFIGKVGNAVPTGNAIAVLHDVWTNMLYLSGNFNFFTNVGTMLPSLVVTEAALLSGPTSSVLLEIIRSIER